MIPTLNPRFTPGASVTPIADGGWHLEIPSGQRGQYRLAQLDDYSRLSRRAFLWRPPLTPREPRGVALSLRARVSAHDLPGTWGFGLWNDPFGFAIGFGGTARRLPALPNAAWFFHASPENYLSLRGVSGNEIPANGFFAGTFRSPRWSSLLLAPGLLALPLLALRPVSRLLRRLASQIVCQDAAAVRVDVTQWHEYTLSWLCEAARFEVGGKVILTTPLAPHGPLGLVIWIDNQYAAWRPDGSLGYGTLENPAAWLEIENIVASG
ncbi:MAG: hypothetical protein Q8M58_02365 [Anaerolineales bacterium]|nr:hypothetical protein [Anaerolineales bacterium]